MIAGTGAIPIPAFFRGGEARLRSMVYGLYQMKEQTMDNEVVRLLGSGFCRLSGKNRAEILGMVTALAFTQAACGQTAKAPMHALTDALGSAVNSARSGFLVRGDTQSG